MRSEKTNPNDSIRIKAKSLERDENLANGKNSNQLDNYDDCTVDDSKLISNNVQRKTWETSPKHVEELTRSLSRLRDDEHGNRLMEQTFERSKKQTNGRVVKDGGVSKTTKTKPTNEFGSDANRKKSNLVHYSIKKDHKPFGTNTNVSTHPIEANQTSFLPPLTGFSDSDSSFSSFVCSSEDCDKIHCICETLRRTELQENEFYDNHHGDNNDHNNNHNHVGFRKYHHDHNGINYIDSGSNQNDWIVMRSKQIRPRDNLKLEGPMDLETTFHSTYGKRSQKQSPQLYLNTRRGRNLSNGFNQSPNTRTTRRKVIRNRPRTSLKAGGHGYWSTNNRDAYRNFIIVDGEARTVASEPNSLLASATSGNNTDSDGTLKLPRVVSKSCTMTSEEKNRCRYGISAKKMHQSSVRQEPMRLLSERETKKIEKKSLVADSNGAGELVTEKLVKKVRHKNDGNDDNDDDRDDDEESGGQDEKIDEGTQTKANHETVEDRNKPRPYDIYRIDHIKDLGLLEEPSNLRDDIEEKQNDQIKPNRSRSLNRKLHETSDDFNQIAGIGKPKMQTVQKMKKPNGHAIMAASNKPFMLPQRIQRHKNDSSINMFEGDMEFTTTNRASYHRPGPVTSTQPRKRTAGRRTQRSGRRRNLFRQSSDSIFAKSENQTPTQETNDTKISKNFNSGATNSSMANRIEKQSIYKSEFGDESLYCPVLDVDNTHKMTKIIGGHKYYNLQKSN
ncbi:hypothetical protein SSS_02346 [Sarcoptes scabiei]|uniref:Uncharacterized protein n=1 Tax=Sarcoptes scabiei TaxID=52283 RepID=A0A834RCT1_SARSC|nr:hypothetical protein SSS_02346 [Sarcoptes scabiei]